MVSTLARQSCISDRAKDITEYLLKSKHHFLGGLVVAACGGEPQYTNCRWTTPMACSGESTGSRGTDLRRHPYYFVLDGQHRLRAIKDAVRQNPDLGKEDICVLIVPTTTRTRAGCGPGGCSPTSTRMPSRPPQPKTSARRGQWLRHLDPPDHRGSRISEAGRTSQGHHVRRGGGGTDAGQGQRAEAGRQGANDVNRTLRHASVSWGRLARRNASKTQSAAI